MEETVQTYRNLIGELPKLNGQLLLYILDLLAVFAENSVANLMPATNLAAIFQPGLLSHPDHNMSPQEYRVSQEVLTFLIEHQDRFLPPRGGSREKLLQGSQPSLQRQPDPPAKYTGQPIAKEPPKELHIARRRSMGAGRKSEASTGFHGVGRVLRRHQSNRIPKSPKVAVKEEEPRRVSEGSTRTGSEPSPVSEHNPAAALKSIERNTPQNARKSSLEEGKDGN